MHDEVRRFLLSSTEVPWEMASVVEVGSADWNGQARDICIGWRSWVGIDLADTHGVDIVGDACDILPTLAPCDVVVSPEVGDHAAPSSPPCALRSAWTAGWCSRAPARADRLTVPTERTD